MTSIYKVIFAGALLTSVASASEVNPTFNYQGRFTDSAGKAKTGSIGLIFQIYSPDGACLLYEETNSNISLSANGIVNVKVGSKIASIKRTAQDPGLNMVRVFSNDSSHAQASRSFCEAGYAPQSGDARLVRVTLLENGRSVVLNPDQVISSVPTSMVAESLQGQTLQDLDIRFMKPDKIDNLIAGRVCRTNGSKISCDLDLSSASGPKGDKGDQGEKGIQGIQGIQGLKGDTGLAGAKGDKGEKGIQGILGIQGLKGDTGLAGAKGDKGEKGIQGILGIQGLKGDAGLAGAKGDKGEKGIQGVQGVQGLKGDTGLAGAKGDKGEKGIQGILGIQGLKGDAGVAGAKGDKGEKGIQGIQGIQGLKGDAGVAGIKGDTGLTGARGPAGINGNDGRGFSALGTNCPEGQIMIGLNANGTLNCKKDNVSYAKGKNPKCPKGTSATMRRWTSGQCANSGFACQPYQGWSGSVPSCESCISWEKCHMCYADAWDAVQCTVDP